MSYEGSEEFLCANGHYFCQSCYSDAPPHCWHCDAPLAYWHAIDETNGEDDRLPSTKPAPKQQAGWDDRWHHDHYGNRYATKILRYVPGGEWTKLRRAAASEQD
jgi:hypothetical protein